MKEFSMDRTNLQKNICVSSKECSMQVTCMEHLDKGKRKIHLDSGESFILYCNEVRNLGIREGDVLSEEMYQRILTEIIGKRVKKRALYLLEKMDRTESQLREKLTASEYPKECIEDAIAYVYKFHYLDDQRYARNYIRYSQEKLSRQQLKQKLMAKGVKREDIELALEEEYSGDEGAQIRKLLEKRHYKGEGRDTAEFRKTYQYILRRGFRSNDILREMNHISTRYCIFCCDNSI